MGDKVAAEVADDEAGGSAERGEQEAFGEHLEDDASAACSECETGADFALTGGGTGKEEVCEVDTCEQEYETREREQHVGRLGERIQVVEATISGLELKMKLSGSFSVGHAGSCGFAEDDVEFGFCAGFGDVGTQACHYEQPPGLWIVEQRVAALLRARHKLRLHGERTNIWVAVSVFRPVNFAGATPMTVIGTPLSEMVLPRAEDERLKCAAQ